MRGLLFLAQIILFIMIWPLLTLLLIVNAFFLTRDDRTLQSLADDSEGEDITRRLPADISDPEDGKCELEEDGCSKSPLTEHEPEEVCVLFISGVGCQ